MVSSFFVYGTLKRGQSRCGLWPKQPNNVRAAWCWGHLFGHSDYPAMTAGNDQIHGELWLFSENDVPQVIGVLDEIEVTNQPGQPDLYKRVIVPVFDHRQGCDQEKMLVDRAYTYLYARDPLADGFQRITGQTVQWP